MVLSMGTTNTLYLPHRINIAMRLNFNTIFYVQYRSEEISPGHRDDKGTELRNVNSLTWSKFCYTEQILPQGKRANRDNSGTFCEQNKLKG